MVVSAVPEPGVTDGDDAWHAIRHTRIQGLASMPVCRTRPDLTQDAALRDATSGAGLCYRPGMGAPGHR